MTKLIEPLLQAFPQFSWSLDRYHDAIARGVLTTADRVELIYGKLIENMPSGGLHAECVQMVADFFRERFLSSHLIREEKPTTLTTLTSEPEPDVAIVTRKRYAPNHPSAADIYLVAEVADTSLTKDQTIKVALYAEANIQEYWIINLVKRRIEVHLHPLPDERNYESVIAYAEGKTFMSPFVGEVVVAELLPVAEA